jgi:hypothetical protein
MAPQLQHFVPQFILRRFTANDRDQVNVFDKHLGTTFTANFRKLAAIKNYYDFDFERQRMTIEPSLARIESLAASHVERILRERRLNVSDPVERFELSRFLSIQMVRTPAVEMADADLSGRLKAWLLDNGMRDDFFAPDPALGDGPNADRATMALRIARAPQEFALMLAEKDWLLLETNPTNPYLIGDHPFAMHNDNETWPRGNIGLNVEGIQIYFPLSPEITLTLWCPALRQSFVDGVTRLKNATEVEAQPSGSLPDAQASLVEIMEAIRTGEPLATKAQTVDFNNSLQVANAERFVFSSNGDFTLAKSMIRSNPNFRNGRRYQEGTGKF